MIGFQLQGAVDGWPDSVWHLPAGTPLKTIDGGQRLAEAYSRNNGLHYNLRHFVGEQNPQAVGIGLDTKFTINPLWEDERVMREERAWYTERAESFFADMEMSLVDDPNNLGGFVAELHYHDHARAFFATFIDGSFDQFAAAVTSVSEYNEYFANSQDAVERQRWIDWAIACVEVWRDDYRTQAKYAHIGLVLAETAVGNDIPMELAAMSHKYPWVHLGYHTYVPVWQGVIRPDAWEWYSGRFEKMDERYRAAGYTNVTWFFGEFGAVGHNGPGWPNSLAANDGWRHPDVYNGNLTAFEGMMLDWMTRVGQTLAWQQNRIIGATIFTSGGGSLWKWYEVRQPEMTHIAQFVAANSPARDVITPPAPPDPPTGTPDGAPRVQYRREYRALPQSTGFEKYMATCAEAFWDKATIGFSYDDAGIGALDDKTAWLFDISPGMSGVFKAWFDEHYPGTRLEMKGTPYVGRNPGTELHMPLAGMPTMTQQYGENYTLYMQRFGLPGHNGLDWSVGIGTQVFMSAPGEVKHTGYDANGYGTYVIIDHGEGVETIYAHLSYTEQLLPGYWYDTGTSIGLSGNSGWSAGPHLHFGIKVDGQHRDPAQWLV